MAKDWYVEGFEKLLSEVADNTGEDVEIVRKIYGGISEVGLTDYDIEKEVIWDRYYAEEEDDD